MEQKRSIRFGPAGNPDSFLEQGRKSSLEMPEWLAEMGLHAYEYQCGRGVRIGEDMARRLGEKGREYGVALSVHAPYYISMSSTQEDKRLGSIRYILESARAVDWMGGDRIVVHSGSCGKIGREEALELAVDTMRRALQALDGAGLGHIHPCPEVMGKTGQLGTLEEVLALCALDERLIPCVDFGHLNARTFGGVKTEADCAAVFDAVRRQLGDGREQSIHIHFSRIEYTEKGGEKRHWNFSDTRFGPDFPPLARVLAKRGLTPVIICESAGMQAEDACAMRDMYREACENLQQEAT